MQRVAFKMYLKPNCAVEYKKRHDLIWPEIKVLLAAEGIFDYTIYLDDETNALYAFQSINGIGNSQDLGKSPIIQKWWAYMADIMETNIDNSPISKSLIEVFHLD